jgi:hypothetical protein
LAGNNEDGKIQPKSLENNGSLPDNSIPENGHINLECSTSNGCACSKNGTTKRIIIDF